MALKATIHKVRLQLADMDRNLYGDHDLTIARHPSETDERMLVRVLAYALNVPADDERGRLELAKSLWDTDEPDLWQVDLTGQVVQWIELGQPDERRLSKAASRAERVTVYSYASSTPIWWQGLQGKLVRAPKVEVWSIAPESSQALAALVERTMAWQVTVQDGTVWVSDTKNTVEITPVRLKAREG
ncbi:MAG TPA: YaeQ family protein [Burkholderiaceae bacterium]